MRLPRLASSDATPLAVSWSIAPESDDGIFVEPLGDEPGWQVSFAIAESIRAVEDEVAFAADVQSRLERVPLARDVHHEDREVWLVYGRPPGLLVALAADRATRRWRAQAR